MPTVVKGTSRAWIRPGGLDNNRYGYELVVPTPVAVNDHLSSIRGRAPRERRAPVSPLSIKKRSEDRNRAGDQTSQAAPSPRLCLTRLISSPFRESEGDLGMWWWCPRIVVQWMTLVRDSNARPPPSSPSQFLPGSLPAPAALAVTPAS